MVWRPDLDSSHAEAQKIAHLLVPYTRGRGVDAGSGCNVVFPHFIRVDSGKDFGGQKVADVHGDARDLSMFAEGSLDFVFSSHFLEHVKHPLATLESWWSRIRVGGNLVLYLPHADLYPRIGQPGSNPDHKSDFVPDDIIKLMGMVTHRTGAGWMIRENEVRGDDDEYSFFMVFEKRDDARTLGLPWVRNPGGKPRCLVIRYGAIGDAIQTTSIFPGLAAKGWHVTVNTTPNGYEVMRENPFVDDWLVQDVDQVPNGLLLSYWLRLGERYDHIINLSGSIEDGLLPHPERDVAYFWPAEARRRIFGPVNYLERLHDIADVPHEFAQAFYPGPDLAAAAKAIRDIRGPQRRPVVLWALAGSGVHKSWPYVHLAAAGLLNYSDAALVFTGDAMCQALEEAVAHHLIEMAGEDPAQLDGQPREELQKAMDRLYPGRIRFTSGLWPIRQTLACAQLADVVVGPETGVLNAVGLEDNHKVVFLSHSSADNLTKHWKNTAALVGAADCYPCHRLHFGWDWCQQDKDTGAAACASRIGPSRVIEAVITALNARQAEGGMSRHQHRWSEHDETDEAPERRTCSDCGLTEVTFAAALRRAEIVAAAMADQGPGRPKVAIVGSFD